VSRSCKLFQLASFQTFQQHVQTPLSVRPAMDFLSKTQIWEDICNRPGDVDSRPDMLIHKASSAFKIKTSRLQSSWSGHACYTYGNCLHQINRLDDHSLGPDERTLDMKLRAAEVRPSRRHGNIVKTRLKSGKNFSEILESQSHSCLS